MRKELFGAKVKRVSLLMVLILVVTTAVVGCGKKEENKEPKAESSKAKENNAGEKNILGEGKTQISFTVVDKDGKETAFEIHTDEEMVGDALFEHELIEGEEGQYGLYVKKVNGITADYDVDKTYWAFYVNDEYATAGVESTPVKEGDSYAFKVEE